MSKKRARLNVESLESRLVLSHPAGLPALVAAPLPHHPHLLAGPVSHHAKAAGVANVIINPPPPIIKSSPVNFPPGLKAAEAWDAIMAKAKQLGGQFTGSRLSDLQAVPGGYRVLFQNCDIYDSDYTGAHEVHGAIRDHYNALGGPRSFLGLPTCDVVDLLGNGQVVHFQGGSIYWSPSTGAHEVHGAIRDEWASLGWQNSFLGYPTSDEMDDGAGGRVSYFQGGKILWTLQDGATAVPLSQTYDSGWLTTDDPLGGFVHLVVTSDGWVTWQSHARDSGFDNEAYSFVVAMAFPDGHVITFQHSGSTEGTNTWRPWHDPNRDDDYTNTEFNQFIHDHAYELSGVKFKAFAVAHDSTLQAIESYAESLIDDFVKSFVQQLGQDAAKGVESLFI
jgi:hypothetical protein